MWFLWMAYIRLMDDMLTKKKSIRKKGANGTCLLPIEAKIHR